MKYFCLSFLLLITACSQVAEATVPPPINIPLEITAPIDGSEFVDSSLILEWDASDLLEGQFFVVQLWYGEENPREVWLQEKSFNAKEFIDGFSQPVGDYHWKIAVLNTNAEGGFDSLAVDWTNTQTLHRVRRLSLTALPIEQMSDTARFIAEQNFETAREIIDFTRDWMYQNTILGDELLVYAPDYGDAAQMMYDYSVGVSEAPQMWCNGISTSMLTVLLELGIESRLIFLYGETPGWVSQHTVLEVFNPDSQAWEVQDSTYNRYFVERATGERVSIARMIFGSMDNIDACILGTCNNAENMGNLLDILGAFRYGHVPEVYVNPDKFNMSRRVEAFDNENFPEFIARIAGVPVSEMIFHFDSWE